MDSKDKTVEQLEADVRVASAAFDPRRPLVHSEPVGLRRSPLSSILDQVEGLRLGLEQIEQSAGWIIQARMNALAHTAEDRGPNTQDVVLKLARRISLIADELRNSK